MLVIFSILQVCIQNYSCLITVGLSTKSGVPVKLFLAKSDERFSLYSLTFFAFCYGFIGVVTAVVFSLAHPRKWYALPVRTLELFGRAHS